MQQGSTELEGPVVPAPRKRIISSNLPPNNVKAHVKSVSARRRGRSSTAKVSADKRGRRRRECAKCDGGGTIIFQRKVELPAPIARGMSPEQKTGSRR